jgi:protein SCO1/2
MRPVAIGVVLALAATMSGDAVAPPLARETSGQSPARAIGPSIYALDVPLVDERGRTLTLRELRGRPLVASMVYTTCTSVCPSITQQLRAVEAALSADVRHGVTFALFSLDPGRDTREALAGFAAAHHLHPDVWRLFAANEADVRTLAAVFGVRYRPEPAGEIAHSAVVVVIDRDGVIRHRQEGLGNNPDALAARILSVAP